ncbi:hypothetical protein EDB84DRAFT_255162 [Lactarius hengduanensis]|nr:hypothetical protein EDB84DRAFT_255162 [Lactarius hengduanensis]
MRRLTASPRKDPPGRHTIQVEPANPLSLSGAYLLKKKRGYCTDAGRAFGLESKIAPCPGICSAATMSPISDLRALQGVVDGASAARYRSRTCSSRRNVPIAEAPIAEGRELIERQASAHKRACPARTTGPRKGCRERGEKVRSVPSGSVSGQYVTLCRSGPVGPRRARGQATYRDRRRSGRREGGARAELTVRGNGGNIGSAMMTKKSRK